MMGSEMKNNLIKKIESYREDILSSGKDGVVILKENSELLHKIFSDAKELIKVHNENVELNSFIKSALKDTFFKNSVGVAIVSKSQIVLRFQKEKENIFDLMKTVFGDNKSLNKFLYKSIHNYLVKLKLEYLSIDNIFNIPKIYSNLTNDLIEFIKNSIELTEKLNDTSINIDEIHIKNSLSNLKIKQISQELLKNAINTTYFVEFITDFFLRSLSTSNTLHLKFLRLFFESEIIREDDLNFAMLRKNSVEREKVLKLIDKEERIIEEAKEKVNIFAKSKREQEVKTINLEKELNEKLEIAKAIEAELKETLQKRDKLKKDDKALQEFSNEIKELNSQKTKFDIEVKNLNSKYELSKQAIININQDREDYLKLLPEIIETGENKIDKHIQKLSSFEMEYIKIKSFVSKKLNEKRSDFDFEEFVKGLNKIVIDKKYSEAIKSRRDANEKRFEGLPIDELEKLEKDIFKTEEEIERLMGVIVNKSLKKELNFKKITNIYFMNNNIKVIQKYLFDLLKKIVKESDEVLIVGFGNFLLRKKFNFVLEIEAKILLNLVMESDTNAENFLSYYDGKIEEDLSGKYKKPEIIDNNSKINPSRVILSVNQYKNYSNFLIKKNSMLKELIIKLKNMKEDIDSNTKKDMKAKHIQEEYKLTLVEIESNKKHKNNFINSQKHIKNSFEKSIFLVAKTLHKKRIKIE